MRFPEIKLAGSCFVFKRKIIDHIGLFPELCRIWKNDEWLSWIVTEVHQKKTVFLPQVVVHHFRRKSSSFIRRDEFNRIVFSDQLAFNKIKEDYYRKQLEMHS